MKKFLTAIALCAALSVPAQAAEEPRGAVPAASRGGAIAKLPKDKAIMVRAALQAAREKSAGLRSDMRAKQAELRALLGAEKFDRKAYVEKRKEIAALRERIDGEQAEAYASVVEKLDVADRRTLAAPRTGPAASVTHPAKAARAAP